MRVDSSSEFGSIADRIRAEYGEMPGLRLTLPQACRLWQLDHATCEGVLQALVQEGFLMRTRDDAFLVFPTASRALSIADVRRRLNRSA